MYRVRELRLGSYSRRAWQNIDHILPRLTQPAPLLETFSVVSSASHQRSQLPGNLFTGHAPRLRTLELIGCIVPQTFPLLTGITSLKIRDTNQVPHGLSLDELIIILKSFPNIQALELHKAHRSESVGPTGSVPPGRTVHLPYLRRLDISYDPLTCAALLSCLKYPITTTQNIKTMYKGRLEGFRRLDAIFAARACPIAYVQVCKVPTAGFAFRGWGGAGARLQLPADAPHINIQLSCHGPSSLAPLRAVWQALPMAGLESLFLSGNFSGDACLGDFGNLSSLKTVRVEGALFKILRVLKQGLPECGLENNNAFPFSQELAEPGRLSFKALRTLVLGGQYLDLSGRIREATELTRCFRERRKRGVPLRKLYISKSLLRKGIDGEITRIFHTAVKEVHWGLHDRGISFDTEDYSSGESSDID
ncbi:hypothetical protein D9615_007152 [Tricholomella constricta]|uniref:Uncharacterized protein n=1 Tax=Tricholomella constricta TaxID=117010 RepID=A0A8H5M259_9AGAR|nr:hypothetical protein D9615_007152 [Tricholomella constricta]